jgi:hypothetical protein
MIFGRLSERLGLLDKETCPLYSRLGFRRGIPFEVRKRM